MRTALFLQPDGEWSRAVQQALPEDVIALEARGWRAALEVATTVPVALVVFELPRLTDEAAAMWREVREVCPQAVTLCLAPEQVIGQPNLGEAVSPDFWVTMPVEREVLRRLLQPVAQRVRSLEAEPAEATQGQESVPPGQAVARPQHEALYRLLAGLAGVQDDEQLFDIYMQTVRALTRCVTDCLLWVSDDGRQYRVRAARGLHPSLVASGRLLSMDALPMWLRRTRQAATAGALGGKHGAPERADARRELQTFGGVLAVPMFCEAALRGILIVGPRAVAEPYGDDEVEALYLLSANVALAADQVRLHRRMDRQKRRMERILATMRSGLVGLDSEGRISVCNEYAREVLGLTEEVVGEDLRCLPAPLGDYLYEALSDGTARVNEEVSVRGGEVILRVSTYALPGEGGEPAESLAVLEDVTAQRRLAQERKNAERLAMLNQFAARVAHEVKNPLAAIQTFAELLPERSGDADFREFWAQTVTRDIARVDELVKKLVSLVDVSPVARETVPVRELLDRTLREFAELDREGRAVTNVTVGQDVPEVYVDQKRTASALVHLLRYCRGRGQEPIEVRALAGPGRGGAASVTLEITGANGEAPEIVDNLLNPVYALEHPEVDLGPAASQRVIEGQGGRVQVAKADEQIVFRVSVPTTAADAEAPLHSTADTTSPQERGTQDAPGHSGH